MLLTLETFRMRLAFLAEVSSGRIRYADYLFFQVCPPSRVSCRRRITARNSHLGTTLSVVFMMYLRGKHLSTLLRFQPARDM